MPKHPVNNPQSWPQKASGTKPKAMITKKIVKQEANTQTLQHWPMESFRNMQYLKWELKDSSLNLH